ncbi:flagellar motor stator protein MotA [Bacillus sp. BRMEA1]|uniref:flagellar motor stator protein MotA n=1 Tax=Neobacillus endophyticus TaxID=2738405 RepID=UPI00156670B2|nr:flagellar motor stator protein MotA [Neobacillus endophyticus]NRD79370.1 flagellar motor stator protein MotA [Neobacillus endophyticus]
MKEPSTVIGLVMALVAVGVGMILKGASLTSLINPAAYTIILGGTAATLFVSFPMAEIKKFPKLMKIIFGGSSNLITKIELIEKFANWANLVRKEGLLGLENELENVDDKFLKDGLELIIDTTDSEFTQDVLLEKINAMQERHRKGALIFSQAGMYAPTLGVLGAVVGLIAALGNLSDIEKLGHSIAAAFISTLLGIFTGYVLWHPMSNKLKLISKKEVEVRQIMVEGLLALQDGMNSRQLEHKLSVYLTPEELAAKNNQADKQMEGSRVQEEAS